MGAPELGLKFTCTSCGLRFYDLLKSPAICPRCATEQPKPKPRAFAPSRPMGRNWAAPAKAAIVATEADPVAADADELLDDEDDDVVEPDPIDEDDDDDAVPAPIIEE